MKVIRNEGRLTTMFTQWPARSLPVPAAVSSGPTLDGRIELEASNRTSSSSLTLTSLVRDPALLAFREIELDLDFFVLPGALT